MPVVVLASGAGTLLQAIIDAQGESYLVAAVVTDQQCVANDRAISAGIPTVIVALDQCESREQWNAKLAESVSEYQPELIVSAGFMKILGKTFLDHFPGKIINTHPALLPSFPGAHAVRDALAHGVKITGTTVHFIDEGVDTGPIIAQIPVPVMKDDTIKTLHERIKQAERKLIVDVLKDPQLRP